MKLKYSFIRFYQNKNEEWVQTSTSVDLNGFYPKETSTDDIIMFQHPPDPYHKESMRPVFGFIDNDFLLRLEYDSSTQKIKIVEKIQKGDDYINLMSA